MLPSRPNIFNVKISLDGIERREIPDFSRNRCIAVCGETLVLAPATTQIGDYIVAVQGFSATLALRKVSDSRARSASLEKHHACYLFIVER